MLYIKKQQLNYMYRDSKSSLQLFSPEKSLVYKCCLQKTCSAMSLILRWTVLCSKTLCSCCFLFFFFSSYFSHSSISRSFLTFTLSVIQMGSLGITIHSSATWSLLRIFSPEKSLVYKCCLQRKMLCHVSLMLEYIVLCSWTLCSRCFLSFFFSSSFSHSSIFSFILADTLSPIQMGSLGIAVHSSVKWLYFRFSAQKRAWSTNSVHKKLFCYVSLFSDGLYCVLEFSVSDAFFSSSFLFLHVLVYSFWYVIFYSEGFLGNFSARCFKSPCPDWHSTRTHFVLSISSQNLFLFPKFPHLAFIGFWLPFSLPSPARIYSSFGNSHILFL